MCGICGIIDYNQASQVNKVTLEGMCSKMIHRGPDDQGLYVNNSGPAVGLGHRRLSIIDLSAAGHQPMSNEDDKIHLVFNGEIYNYKELRPLLERKGHHFKSHTDAETIIHLYEEYGRDCVKYLHGMFAFAIWDEKERQLFIARDRLGKKPLLYYFKNGRFCFASEFNALLASGMVDKEINHSSIYQYIVLSYVPAPLSVYKDVFKLMPAHTLLLKDGKITTSCYWELDYSKKIIISEEEAQEELLRILKEAIRIRLYSDVPLGAFLSGGIDSSTVVALMAELSGKRVDTFSIGFEESSYNELGFAREVARRYNTNHHEIIVRPNALEILPKLVEHYGEPYGDSSCVPTYYVAEATRKCVTVALSGDGGDEGFAGYERHQAAIFGERYHRLPQALRKSILSIVSSIPSAKEPKATLGRLVKFLKGAELDFAGRYAYWMSIFNEEDRNSLFKNNDISWQNRIYSVLDERPQLGILDKLLRCDTLTTLADDFLVKVDIACMSNSLELRSPFLDQEVLEFAASLPEEYKLKNRVNKYILKKAIKPIVPAKNIYRKKMGFSIPVAKWFRGEMKDYLKSNLLSERSLGRGYFNPEEVKSLVETHINGRADNGFKLWSLLMLELWHQKFIDT